MTGIHPEWSYDAVLYEMNIRQLTAEGTFAAAAERLEFLRDMGVDAVWLMPIHPIGEKGRKGSLGSYYSVRDYTDVNPEFGTMADFDAFLAKAHSLGMKVLLDWVANHTARDARWIEEKPREWYVRDQSGEAAVPWDWTDAAKLDYGNREVWQGQIDAMRFWLERGVDGFRCDMAMLVPIEFWQQTVAELRKVRRDVFMLAEAEETNLFDRAFDASYSWKLFHIMNDVAACKCRVWPLRDGIYADAMTYPPTAMRLMFTSNHDENSWNGTEFRRMGAAARVMAALTFVMPQGMPLIYTGQEFGYDHSFEFFERDSMPQFEANEYTDFYRRLCALKHANAALRAGERGGKMVEIENNARDCMLSFVREVDGNRVVALLNISPYTILADFDTGIYAGEYTDAMTGRRCCLQPHIMEQMDPWSFKILTKNEK